MGAAVVFSGDVRLILSQRIDDLSPALEVRLGMSTERERRVLGERGELGVLSSHHCSVTLIVTVKLLGCNKLVRHLVQAN